MKNGWQTQLLGELLQRTDTINPLQSPNREFEYIDVSSVSNETFEIATTQRLKGKEAPSRARREVRQNDILFATVRPTLKRIAIVPPELDSQVCSTGYFVLRPNAALHYKFLFYWLFDAAFNGAMEELQKGASYPAVTDGDVRAQPMSFPSLPEQQRIVNILDEAFDAIATAKSNTEKNLQNARALFESYLEGVYTSPGNDWLEKNLGQIADSISTGPFGTMLHKSDYVPDGIPLINPMNIIGSRIVPSNRMMVSEKTRKRLQNYVLRAGDVVIARRGEMGRCAVITDTEVGWLCGTGSFFVRLSNSIDARFFVALFSSKQFRARLEGSAVGTTMSNLNHAILNDLPIPVPPIPEQKSIMLTVELMERKVERLESIYRQKLAALDALKKSLLHQAFNAQL